MTKRRRIAGFALLVGVAIGVTFYVTRPREPVYQGRTLSEWLADLSDKMHSQETDDKACEALRQIGTKALPHIRSMLCTENSAIKDRINGLLDRQSVIEFRFETADLDHAVALLACIALGPAAKEASPDLRHLLLEVRTSDGLVGRALAGFGSGSVPILLEALTSKDTVIRSSGAFGLCLMGTNAQTALPQLMIALKDPDSHTRRNAAIALANVGQDSETWMPVMVELLRHKDPGERFTTIYHLEEIGKKAKGVVPALSAALEDEDSEVRRRAAEALKQIDPEAAAKAGVK